MSIRGIQEDLYTIVDATNAAQPKILEEIEVSRVMFEAFEGAVVCLVPSLDGLLPLPLTHANLI